MTEQFQWFCDEWLRLAKQANQTNDVEDWRMYQFFLLEARKTFSKAYITMDNEPLAKLVGVILKDLACQLHKISIKYKNDAMPF